MSIASTAATAAILTGGTGAFPTSSSVSVRGGGGTGWIGRRWWLGRGVVMQRGVPTRRGILKTIVNLIYSTKNTIITLDIGLHMGLIEGGVNFQTVLANLHSIENKRPLRSSRIHKLHEGKAVCEVINNSDIRDRATRG